MSITMYAPHVVHDAETMMADGPRIDETLSAIGHDWQEEMFVSEDLTQMLLIAQFGSSKDVVAHFTKMEDLGYSDYLGRVFSVTGAYWVGDLDDEARAVLSKYDFNHFVSAPPQP